MTAMEPQTNWRLHLTVWHNPNNGRCAAHSTCPQEGMVWTLEGEPRLSDDPTRQWTEQELDAGLPWR